MVPPAHRFPHYGKLLRRFSIPWKISFHTVENQARFFHVMEDFSPILPRYGRFLSTLWKSVVLGRWSCAGQGGFGELWLIIWSAAA